MKCVLVILMLFPIIAYAQDAAPYITDEDVIICFPLEGPKLAGAGMNWQRPEILSIEYSAAPVGRHKIIERNNMQVWEALLQKDRPRLGKVIITILVEQKDFDRLQGIKIRARRDEKIGRWSRIRAVVVRKI